MPTERSQRRRIITPSNKKANLASIADAILAPKRKSVKKSTTNTPQTRRAPTRESASEDEQEEVEEVPRAPPRSRLPPIDVNIEKFEVSCNAMFGEKKLAPVGGTFHLREFKVHDYNAKVIKIVEKEAEKTKVGFEMDSCIATVSGTRIKSLSTSIDDNTDWERLEQTIERYMRERIKMLRVDYVVNFVKTRRHGNSDQPEACEGTDDEDAPVRKTRRNNAFPLLNYADLELQNRST